MKKLFAALLCLAVAVAFTGCHHHHHHDHGRKTIELGPRPNNRLPGPPKPAKPPMPKGW